MAEKIALITGATGQDGAYFELDTSKPDGMPRKLMDSSCLRSLGWQPGIGLREGIQRTYHWFTDNFAAAA